MNRFLVTTAYMLSIMPLLYMYEAFVLTQIWNWYLVPAFSIAELPKASAFGIAIFFNLVMIRRNDIQGKFDEELIAEKGIVYYHLFVSTFSVLASSFFWLIAYMGTLL